MKVFVTGATGGVGQHVVQHLLKKNFEVACLVRTPQKLNPKAIAFVGDLQSISDIETQFAEFKPETIVHLGWIGVDQKEKNNNSQILNLQAATQLLGFARKYSVKQFIGMGSESEYGIHNRKIDETTPVLPVSNYAVAKLATGLLCEKLCKDGQIKFAWLRLFSSYGPGDRPGSLMSALIRSLLNNEAMNLSQCIQVWDYVHADDIANLISIMTDDIKESGFYNLGGGDAQPLKNIVLKIASLINSKAQLRFGAVPYQPNQNMHLEADISKICRTYDWKPQINLEDGLRETIEWHRKSAN